MKKFRYIASEHGRYQYIGQKISLHGTFKIFQNNSYIEKHFVNEIFTVIEVLKNGLMLRGEGYGEIVDTDDDDTTSFYAAQYKYGEGPFLLTKKEMNKRR